MKRLKFALLCIALLLCMGVIFFFSAQDGTLTNVNSMAALRKLVDILNAIFPLHLDDAGKAALVADSNLFARKVMHWLIYCLIGAFACGLLSLTKLRRGWVLALSFAIPTVYAICDELHQASVPGRTPRITDILIDCMGAIAGIALVALIHTLHKRRKKRSNKDSCS